MNIKKRFIISNTLIVVIPLVITMIIMWAFLFFYVDIAGEGVKYHEVERHMYVQSEIMAISNDILKDKIINLEDKSFQNKLSERLSNINGKFILIKEGKILIKPNDINEIDVEKCIDVSEDSYINRVVTIGNVSYIVKNIIKSNSNNTSMIILMAPIDKNKINLFGKIVITSFIVFVVCFILINTYMACVLSKKIVTPIRHLKKATTEISSGNLDYVISEEGDREVRELCRDFELMRIQLKDSIIMKMKYDNDRKGLISAISHDLKTPITSIKGYVEGILDGVANTEDKRNAYLRTIYTKAGHMDNMIDDLLLCSKLDLNKVPFNFEKVDVVEYLTYCMCECEEDLKKDNIKIYLNNELKNDRFVMMDRERMSRVILNIIGNSQKYMDKPEGKIDINLRETTSSIIIEIRDNGPGIDNDDVNKIFERFYRTDSARSGAKGSGLGLVIAKQIVEGHKGNIWAINHKGNGVSIIMSLSKVV